MPFQEQYRILVASDVIKNVNVVFPQAQAMVLPGPPQKFVVRGVDRCKDKVANERFKCLWDRSQCPTDGFDSPADLYDHVLQHLFEYTDVPCIWSTCSRRPQGKSALRAHILTHFSTSQPPSKHPSQSDTITLSSAAQPYPMNDPTTRPPPPPQNTTVTFQRPAVDPPSSSLTALLCIRILFRASFASSEVAPRVDADHFGFPGVVEDQEDQDQVEVEPKDGEQEGERRGRKAFVGVRRILEGVRIRDETLMGWITEMVDAGTFGMT